MSISADRNNLQHIDTAMPPSYWLGRFQAVHDRFRSDYLSPSFLEPGEKRIYWMAIPDDIPDTEAEPTRTCKGDERLSKRVFTHLESLCVNNEARKSLKAFQQAYARRFDCEALLPLGGCMVDREGGLFARVGRLVSGGNSGGGGAGRKSSFGVARRRGMLGMSFGGENIGP
jgi:hypothetical protein